jgi:hypothetical protein
LGLTSLHASLALGHDVIVKLRPTVLAALDARLRDTGLAAFIVIAGMAGTTHWNVIIDV